MAIEELKRQVEWFKRQLFGRKSERFAPAPDAHQMHLGQVLGEELEVPEAPGADEQQVSAHKRRKAGSDFADDTGGVPFDEAKVPVETRRDTQTLHCAAAPVGVIEGSRADVSFIARRRSRPGARAQAR